MRLDVAYPPPATVDPDNASKLAVLEGVRTKSLPPISLDQTNPTTDRRADLTVKYYL